MSLLQGMEDARKVELLFSLTSIKSEPVKDALRLHLVKGSSVRDASFICDITQSNFLRALATLKEANDTVNQIQDINWRHLKNKE